VWISNTKLGESKGHDAVIICRDTGPFQLRVEWLRDGDKQVRGVTSENGGRLTIKNLTRDDEGVYVCFVPSINTKTMEGALKVMTLKVLEDCLGLRKLSCHSGECFDESQLCDGHHNCPDDSDELNCDQRPTSISVVQTLPTVMAMGQAQKYSAPASVVQKKKVYETLAKKNSVLHHVTFECEDLGPLSKSPLKVLSFLYSIPEAKTGTRVYRCNDLKGHVLIQGAGGLIIDTYALKPVPEPLLLPVSP